MVDSSRRPRKVIDVEEIDEDRDENDTLCRVSYSDDKEAAWLKKRGRFHYGYKLHMGTDAKDGFVLGGIMTPANLSDTKQFPALVDKLAPPEATPVFADKGYICKSNSKHLEGRKLADAIMSRKPKGKPFSPEEQDRNHQISSVRYIVERTFGTLKQHFHFIVHVTLELARLRQSSTS